MSALRKTLTAALLAFAGLTGAAQAGPFDLFFPSSYSLENRPHVVFPDRNGGIVHISPYPTTKRAASVWSSDLCWRTCTGQTAWRFDDCRVGHGPEACRPRLDADNRTCLRACRTHGGPMLNLAN